MSLSTTSFCICFVKSMQRLVFFARQCTISMQTHSCRTNNRRTNSQSTRIHSRCCWNLIVLLFPTLLTFLNLFVWILFIFLIQQSSITIHWKTSKTKKKSSKLIFCPLFPKSSVTAAQKAQSSNILPQSINKCVNRH